MDQVITGNFLVEAGSFGGQTVVKVALFNASMTLGDPNDPFIDIPDADGGFIISAQGVSASLTINNPAFNIPGIDAGITFDSIHLEFNSVPAPVQETFVVVDELGDDLTVELDLVAGPFVRVVLLGADINFNVGGASILVEGDFLFDQTTNADGTKTTRIGATNVEIDLAAEGLGEGSFSNGQGGFIITSAGLAGVLSGNADIGVGPVDAGGTIIVRVNNTGAAVDETIVIGSKSIDIRFGESEGDIFAVSISDLTLTIGDFVSVEGNVSFIDQGDRFTFAGDGLEIFLGQGPAKLEGGDINPLATGVLLSDAKIGVIKYTTPEGTTFAMYAEGTVQLLGLDGVTLSGTAVVRVNTTGMAINETLTIPGSSAGGVDVVFDTADRVTVLQALNVDMDIMGQTLHGNFAFDKVTDENNAGALRIAMTDVSVYLGDGANGVSVTGAVGSFLFTSAGLAGELTGTVNATIPGVSFGGSFTIAVNTTNAPVNEMFTVGDEAITLELPTGPYVRVAGTGVTLDIMGQTLRARRFS